MSLTLSAFPFISLLSSRGTALLVLRICPFGRAVRFPAIMHDRTHALTLTLTLGSVTWQLCVLILKHAPVFS
jgi:hypothetical protein